MIYITKVDPGVVTVRGLFLSTNTSCPAWNPAPRFVHRHHDLHWQSQNPLESPVHVKIAGRCSFPLLEMESIWSSRMFLTYSHMTVLGEKIVPTRDGYMNEWMNESQTNNVGVIWKVCCLISQCGGYIREYRWPINDSLPDGKLGRRHPTHVW